MEPLAACLSTKRASLRGWRRSRGERFGDVEPLAARLSDLLEARGERFGDVERLAACLSTKRASLRVSRRSRGERFGDVEPLAVCLSRIRRHTRERFGDVEPLAACRSTKRASLRGSRRSRGDRFADVEPLAAVLSGFAEARGEAGPSAAQVKSGLVTVTATGDDGVRGCAAPVPARGSPRARGGAPRETTHKGLASASRCPPRPPPPAPGPSGGARSWCPPGKIVVVLRGESSGSSWWGITPRKLPPRPSRSHRRHPCTGPRR